jgi:hypothetical protein
MNANRIIAILLIVAGAFAVAYGGFSYTDTHRAEIGTLQMTVKERDFVSVPVWAGVLTIVAGGLLLGFGKRA